MKVKENVDKGFSLTPAVLPARKTRYRDIVEEFENSGIETALVEGPGAESVKTATLVTSLTAAKKGKPIMVRRVGDKVYLQRKI